MVLERSPDKRHTLVQSQYRRPLLSCFHGVTVARQIYILLAQVQLLVEVRNFALIAQMVERLPEEEKAVRSILTQGAEEVAEKNNAYTNVIV